MGEACALGPIVYLGHLARFSALCWGENYIFTFFKILNCKNTSRFENFAKIPPCRQLLGRQGACRPSTWRQGAKCKNTTGKFESRAGGDLSPKHWATGGLPPSAWATGP